MPLDVKIMQQAAKLGKPVVEAARGSKVSLAIGEIAKRLLAQVESPEAVETATQKSTSLFSKLGGLGGATKPKEKPKAKTK